MSGTEAQGTPQAQEQEKKGQSAGQGETKEEAKECSDGSGKILNF